MGLRGKTRVLAPLLIAAGSMMLMSCGTAVHTTSTPRETSLVPPPEHRAPVTRLRPPGIAVGRTQRVRAQGTTLVVTVTKVIDPLLGSGAKVPASMDVAGVFVSAHNAGPGSYDSSATSDFSLLTAGGSASPVYVPAGPCHTYVQDFMNELGSGQARTGCIAYALPRGRAPRTVRFSPDGGTDGVVRSWQVR